MSGRVDVSMVATVALLAMSNVGLSRSGPPETVLPPDDPNCVAALADALGAEGDPRSAIAAVTADWPRSIACWVALGDHGRDTMERYAAYRVAYHRGLDLMRASGWRGSGFLRATHETNVAFLLALRKLGEMAAEIGEDDEAQRCAQFVEQLDPGWGKG